MTSQYIPDAQTIKDRRASRRRHIRGASRAAMLVELSALDDDVLCVLTRYGRTDARAAANTIMHSRYAHEMEVA